MFSRIRHLIVKELLAAMRDPRARMVLIVPPLIQMLLFSFAITQEVRNVSLAILNEDTGISGEILTRRFENTPTFSNVIHLRHRSETNAVIDEQKAIAVLVIPQTFSRDISNGGQKTSLQILLDGRRANAAPIVGGYMQKIITRFMASQYRGETATGTPIPGVAMHTRHWFNPNLNPRDVAVPSLICILATMLGLVLSGLSIAREREMGTFEQLLVSPLTPFEILVGKAVPAMILATCSATVMVCVTVFLFGIGLKTSLWMLYFSLEIFLLSIIGIGLFISSVSMTQQQAILGCFLVMPPAVMLSGFGTPIENMPMWLQWITVANPLRWYLIIIRGIFLRGTDVKDIFVHLIPISIFSLFTLTAATMMFRRRME